MEQAHQAATFGATGRVEGEFSLHVVEAKWAGVLNALLWQVVLFLLEIGFVDAINSSEGTIRLIVAVTGKVSGQLGWTQSLVAYRTGLQQRGCIFAPLILA